jgi:hypothetical protein
MEGILLDTNVLSELMRKAPSRQVLTWFGVQTDARFFTTAVTRAEILLGIALLPAGKRRDTLAQAAERMFNEEFGDRCLPFDAAAATEYALLVARRTALGKPISTEDAQIAAICLHQAMPLATRNIKDFVDVPGLELVDPWLHT